MAARMAVVALLVAACGGGGDPVPALEFGTQIFADPRLSNNPDNLYSCATCHEASATPDPTRIYPGHTLYDSAFRASWWGGFETDYLRAVNYCYLNFMSAPVELEPDEPKARALYEYLASISPGGPSPAKPLNFTRYVVSIPPGDPVRGEQVYATACTSCHGAIDTGEGRLSKDIPLLPAAIDALAKKIPGADRGTLLVEKVRHGQFWGVGGTSPPFSLDMMSNADLGALLAFLVR
ncbi:MAG TPA: c-type cytochrome [Kofleriaceae bacterium]|nr:c-type cytochrome [Kofleriaceae bacterium]